MIANSIQPMFASYHEVFEDLLKNEIFIAVMKGGRIPIYRGDALTDSYKFYKNVCIFELDQDYFNEGIQAIFDEKFKN
jgi:hypothetical protein